MARPFIFVYLRTNINTEMSALVALVKLQRGQFGSQLFLTEVSMGSVSQLCFRYRSCQHKLILFYSFSIAFDTVYRCNISASSNREIVWSYSHFYKIRSEPNRVELTHLIR
jgi:hypothetical protein